MIRFLVPSLLLLIAGVGIAHAVMQTTAEQLEQHSLNNMFNGAEQMHFAVSWSGGIKIGDLFISIVPVEPGTDRFAIKVRVTDYGLFKLVYPVDDTFTTIVEGPLKLPLQYAVHQREGWGRETWGRETKRLTIYDQQKLEVTYQKNAQPQKKYPIAGTVYNEFSAFFISRALTFEQLDTPIRVPAFVDKQRHEVAVKAVGREVRNSLFGEVATLKIQPKMTFKGLYDKDGDTVFWVTDDECRVPIEIHSKIVVGSLVAELEEYNNSRCTPPSHRNTP